MNKVIVKCSLETLKYYVNPFKKDIWPSFARAKEDIISNVLQNNTFTSQRIDNPDWSKLTHEESLNYHNSRIAYMVKNPDNKPIDIDVSDMAGIIMEDGNHRLSAAIYSNQPDINVSVSPEEIPILEKLSYIHDVKHQVSFAIAMANLYKGKGEIIKQQDENGHERICFLTQDKKLLTPFGEETFSGLANKWSNFHEPISFVQACKKPETFQTYKMQDFVNEYALKDMVDPKMIESAKSFIKENNLTPETPKKKFLGLSLG